MKVLSLFDGMACGALALQAAGIEIESYDAFEIDKYAVQTSSHNFPFINHHGDVFQADATEFEGVDLLCGGSPCTYWSIAQKNNRETEASGMGWELFSQYVRALRQAKPKYFVYENNKSMSKAIRESITSTFGFEPICINSALVSAQNRQRLYWCGVRQPDGTYKKADIPQPEDKGILLKDILESGFAWKDKQGTIDSNYYKGGNYSNPKKQSGQRMCVAEPVSVRLRGRNGEAKYEARTDKKNGAITAERICECAEPVTDFVGIGYRGRMESGRWEKKFEAREDKKANALTTATTDSMCAISCCDPCGYATPCEWDENGKPTKAVSAADGKTYAVYEVKDGKITIKGKQYSIKLADGFYIIRKLTVRECMRLQTVPEWYEFPVSDSRAYKMLGNGFTIDVIAHLLRHMVKAVEE